jgi:tol-pal system protein YbgF
MRAPLALSNLPFLALLATAALSTGCATTGDVVNLEARLVATQAQAGEAGKVYDERLNEYRSRLEATEAENARLKKQLADQTEEIRGWRAESGRFADSTLQTIIELKGKLEELGFKMGGLTTELEKQVAAVKAGPPSEESGGSRIERPKDPKEFYKLVVSLYKERSFKECELLAAEFVAKFPNDRLTDDARLTLGDCYSEEREHNQAIEAYRQILAKHPDGDMVPWAMYKIGMSLAALGDNKSAMEFFRETVNTYPNTTPGNLSKKRLKPEPKAAPAKAPAKPAKPAKKKK